MTSAGFRNGSSIRWNEAEVIEVFWEVGSSSRWFVEEYKLQGCVLLASKTASQTPTLVERNDCGEGRRPRSCNRETED